MHPLQRELDYMNHRENFYDLSQLNDLSESYVISCLLDRFQQGDIYTWLGEDVLVSFNPNQDKSALYSEEIRQTVTKISVPHQIPHIFALAEKCFRRLGSSAENQSVIISGLSGSGKTEAAKHILHYLVYRNHDRRCQKRLIDISTIERTLLKSNIILESFGNAKTICNRNSSRFGKYICLHFDENQLLVGSSLQIYLLEKPRSLFDCSSLKSSFHAFRLFLSSLNESELIEFGLDTLGDDYQKYISNRKLCSADVATWKQLVDALLDLGFSPTDVEQLRLLLAAIILLNSVRFLPASPVRPDYPTNYRIRILAHANADPQSPRETTPIADANSATAVIHPDDLGKVIQAGRLLGLPKGEVADEFARQLITRFVQAGSGSNVYRARRLTEYCTTCTVSQAKEQRDCLVKALYNSLFDFLVQHINDQLHPGSICNAGREFGILDLFGFEILEENGFEQFCINYANERLHQMFMRIAVSSVHDELNSEGLSSNDDLLSTEIHDNSHLLVSLKTCAGLLDEVCLLNRVYERGTRPLNALDSLDPRETDWLRRMQTQLASSAYIFVDNCASTTPSAKTKRTLSLTKTASQVSPSDTRRLSNSFTVQHFAGPVTYTASGFVAKNLDRFPTHLINWLIDVTQSGPSRVVFEDSLPDQDSCRLLRTVLSNANNGALPARNVNAPVPVRRSPLQQRNCPAHLVTPTQSSPSDKRTTLKVHMQSSPSKENVRSPTLLASRRINTVFGNFRASLKCLLERLEAHQISFVRCIRPVLTGSSGINRTTNLTEPLPSSSIVDDKHVKLQLITGGLFDALHILRTAFPARYTYVEFIRKYRVFWRLCSAPPSETLDNTHIAALTDWYTHLIGQDQIPSKRTPLTQRRDTGESETQHHQRMVLLLLILGLNLNPIVEDAAGRDDANQPEWRLLIRQFGRTRIHLTRPQVDRLDRVRSLMRSRAARCLQRWIRGRWIHSRFSLSFECEPPARSTLLPQSPGQPVANLGDVQNCSMIEAKFYSPMRKLPTSPLLFATHLPHIVSYRRLLNQPESLERFSVRYWCASRRSRLDCLIPFVHRPIPVHVCPVRGLIDAVS